MLAKLYHEAALAKAKPSVDWPASELANWAVSALQAAVSPIEAGGLPMQWTRWPSLTDHLGQPREGTWDDLAWGLVATRDARVSHKNRVPLWSPGRYDGNYGDDSKTQALFALVLDCDDHGDWTALLPVLDSLGLAYCAHRTPTHGLAGKGNGPAMIKWRIVFPLAVPVEGASLAQWTKAYTVARIVVGAIGGCWFDPTGANPSRMWFAASTVGDAPERELIWPIAGRALNFAKLIAQMPPPFLSGVQAVRAPYAMGNMAERGRRYLARMGQAAVGERSATAFRGAAWLVHDLGLSDTEAWGLLVEWNGSNLDSLPEGRLRRCLENGRKYGKHRPQLAA